MQTDGKTTDSYIYIGSEGNKEVFETEPGTEIVLHKDDIDKLISK